DALALPFAAEQFDLVYAAGLLEHIQDLPQVMCELSRVTRPGGHVVVGTANRISLARRVMRLVRKVKPFATELTPQTIVMRTVHELVNAAAQASLALDRVCWNYFPLPWHTCTASTENVLSPFATTVIARFVRARGRVD